MSSIQQAETDTDILRCFPVMHELRPHLRQDNFVPTVRRLQAGGYQLAWLETDGAVAAVAGYRFGENLVRGRFLYVDDLVTLSARRRTGQGQQLFAWLVELAGASGCQELHLDSGIQRTDAHRFYEKLKLTFASRHYVLKLMPVC